MRNRGDGGSLIDVGAGRVSAWRQGCTSLFHVFSFVASRVSARQPTHFLLLRQEKVSKEKASRRQGRCAVPCAARIGRVWRKLGFASNMRQPDPPAAALLSPVTTALGAELRLLGFAIANSRDCQLPFGAEVCAHCAVQCERQRTTSAGAHLQRVQAAHPIKQVVSTSSRTNRPSASAATRDTPQPACKVSAANEHVVSGSRSRAPAMENVPSSAAAGGSGLALFERSEFSQTPPDASSAGNPQGTVSGSPFLWFVSFGEAKEMNSAAGPRPGSPRTK